MANLLERSALKRAEKNLRHLMAPGEVIRDFDICEVGNRGRADLIVSDQALYVIPGGQARAAVRLPLGEISDVVYQPDNPFFKQHFMVRTWDGSALQFYAKSWRGVPAIVQRAVPDRLVAEHRLDLYNDGRGVNVRQKRGRETGSFEWQYDVDEGINEDDPDFERRLRDGMEKLAKQVGDYSLVRVDPAKFAAVAGTPVDSWTACPVCDATWAERVPHAVHCSGCGRYFADADFRPIVRNELHRYGQLVATEDDPPLLLADMNRGNDARAWIGRPKDYAAGPMVVEDRRVKGADA